MKRRDLAGDRHGRTGEPELTDETGRSTRRFPLQMYKLCTKIDYGRTMKVVEEVRGLRLLLLNFSGTSARTWVRTLHVRIVDQVIGTGTRYRWNQK